MAWLADWYELQSGRMSRKPVKPSKEKNRPFNDPNAKALLISGAPGIGKTTTVRLLAALLGFDMLEMNASDTRNKASIEQMLTDLSQQALSIRSALIHKTSPAKEKKTLILMDEVDGVGAGDRGGLSALLLILKKTHVPIVLICNERGDRRIQSLLNHSYDVKFTRPTSKEIYKRVFMIAQKERFTVPSQQQLDQICESAGFDIRSVINSLQLLCSSSH